MREARRIREERLGQVDLVVPLQALPAQAARQRRSPRRAIGCARCRHRAGARVGRGAFPLLELTKTGRRQAAALNQPQHAPPNAMARRTRASAASAVETGWELSVLCNGDMLRILLPSLDAASFGSLRCLCTEVRDACSRVCALPAGPNARAWWHVPTRNGAPGFAAVAAPPARVCARLPYKPSVDAAPAPPRVSSSFPRAEQPQELLVWLEDVERAAELYVTPRFKEALAFASSHQQCVARCPAHVCACVEAIATRGLSPASRPTSARQRIAVSHLLGTHALTPDHPQPASRPGLPRTPPFPRHALRPTPRGGVFAGT